MSLEDMRNFKRWSDRLCSAGMPSADQLADAAQKGVQAVINLAPHDSMGALRDEPSVVESLHMAYVNIPVDWNHPTRADLEQFFAAMDAHAQENLIVHCQANYRASAFVTLHRILRQNADRSTALAEMRTIWDPDKYPVWRKFIDEALA